MFGKNSRYQNVPIETVLIETATTADGETVASLTLRVLAQPLSRPAMVTQGDQLDVISQRRFKAATRYWHIADANSELEANALTREPGRMMQTPDKG